jgi:predicted nucleic acid-binding protein
MLIIVDASAIVDMLLGVGTVGRQLLRHELHAPVSVDAEVLHALRRKWLAKAIDDNDAVAALKLYRTVVIIRRPVEPFLDRMWALRNNITAYDAAYVALAESMSVPLFTRDWRLAHSSSHTATIEYIA